MPKMKTNRAAAKRFKKTGSGRIKRAAANHNHILTKKSKVRKRRLREIQDVAQCDQRSISKMLRDQ